MSRRPWTAAAAIWCLSVAAMTAVGVVVSLTGQADSVRSTLAFSFPVRDTWKDLATVLWRNGALSVAALVLADSQPQSRLISRALSFGWALNIGLAGVAIGAYGERLVRHAAVYGLLELAAFSFVLATCLRLRREGGRASGGELSVASALLLMAASTETIWHLGL